VHVACSALGSIPSARKEGRRKEKKIKDMKMKPFSPYGIPVHKIPR
jgi:hypothetical protein